MQILVFASPGVTDRTSSVIPPAKYIARFCHQYWPSKEVLPSITEVPILFISGLKDEIVP